MGYPYPGGVLPPRKVIPDIVPANTGGGRSLTAVEQIVSFDAGFWQIDLTDIPVASIFQKRAWRALSANAEGRLGIIDVPTYPMGVAPVPIGADGLPITSAGGYFSDGTEFSDGTTFDDGEFDSHLTADAALGATSISMFVEDIAQELAPGMDFSVQGVDRMRMYRIRDVTSETPTTGGTNYVLSIRPPLREAIVSGTPAEFSNPTCSCRLLDDTQMRSAADDYAGQGMGALVFVEAIN